MSKVAIIVQARMGSTRLPGKILKPILGKPMLLHQLERLKRCELADEIVLAIPKSEQDLVLLEFANSIPYIKVFQGSESDVLARYFGAALQVSADIVVRITSDCPLIEAAVVDKCIVSFQQTKVDYVSNCHARTYPRGLDTEVFSFKVLSKAYQEATLQPDREHVTAFIWRQPERFKLLDVKDKEDHSDLRWTVDTQEDYELISWIYEQLYPKNPDFSYQNVLDLISEHPEWQSHNLHIQQKHYGE